MFPGITEEFSGDSDQRILSSRRVGRWSLPRFTYRN